MGQREMCDEKVDAMRIQLATMVQQSTEQVSCDLNGEIAILNLKSTLYFGLDEVRRLHLGGAG
jgi:hypothetical protein